MYTIDGQHRLQGADVIHRPTTNHNGAITPKYLVFHYTACSYQAAIATFLRTSGADRSSAHLVIDLDGSVTQMVDFNRRAWHAGESRWDGLTDLNTHSIGIEVVNLGYLNRFADGSFRPKKGGTPVAAGEVVEARHKLPDEHHLHWQVYTREQIATCEALAVALVARYGLRDVVGHDDIAPKRKVDPGPAFPLAALRGAAFGREGDGQAQLLQWEVATDKLNVRAGPGTSFNRMRPPLALGTRLLRVVEGTAPWWLVEPVAHDWPPGWVNASYLRTAG